jgi:hypothetical protein
MFIDFTILNLLSSDKIFQFNIRERQGFKVCGGHGFGEDNRILRV